MKENNRRIPVIDDRPISYDQAKRLRDDLMQRDDDMQQDNEQNNKQ